MSSPNSLACLKHSHRKVLGSESRAGCALRGANCPWEHTGICPSGSEGEASLSWLAQSWWQAGGLALCTALGSLVDLSLAGAGFTFWPSAVTRHRTLKICHCYAVELTLSISLLEVSHGSGLPVFNSLAKHKLFWEIISQLSI